MVEYSKYKTIVDKLDSLKKLETRKKNLASFRAHYPSLPRSLEGRRTMLGELYFNPELGQAALRNVPLSQCPPAQIHVVSRRVYNKKLKEYSETRDEIFQLKKELNLDYDPLVRMVSQCHNAGNHTLNQWLDLTKSSDSETQHDSDLIDVINYELKIEDDFDEAI